MSRRTDAFAEREPYFTVLTADEFRRERMTEAAQAAFFATGEAYVDSVLHTVRQGVDLRGSNEALEYGCGPGRVALPLARRFARVVAVDRSRAMLELAARHAREAGLANVVFLTPEELAPEPRFAFVNCSLLLQRMPSREGLALVRSLLALVRPGGVAVLHFPYRSHAGAALRALRELRGAIAPVNAALNVAKGKPASEPFLPTHLYDADTVKAAVAEQGFTCIAEQPAREGDVDTLTLFVRRGGESAAAAPESDGIDDAPGGPIDVRKLIASKSISELNATAEQYFASLENRDFHLAKPFSSINDTPPILINLAVLLQGLKLLPGHRVLDYGGGTGWLSRILTQFGCEAIVMDVSPTALEIAREMYGRLPVIGTRPAPRFLRFDGERIDLPDASVDRIVCFDAFHHAPNPERILAEFGRILTDGGIAAFAEPGPYHSQTAQSQFEMRTYGVLENDVDIDAIWAAAQNAGFADIRVAVFNIPPFEVTLPQMHDLLAGGETAKRWADWTRGSMNNVRDFFLVKRGLEAVDSRTASALRCTIASAVLREGRVDVTVVNSGQATWLPSSAPVGGVAVGCHLFDAEGRLVRLDFTRAALDGHVGPGETVSVKIELPPLPPGAHTLEIDCVAEGITWFSVQGSATKRLALS
jgi:SAM-dependent methyltransferase